MIHVKYPSSSSYATTHPIQGRGRSLHWPNTVHVEVEPAGDQELHSDLVERIIRTRAASPHGAEEADTGLWSPGGGADPPGTRRGLPLVVVETRISPEA